MCFVLVQTGKKKMGNLQAGDVNYMEFKMMIMIIYI